MFPPNPSIPEEGIKITRGAYKDDYRTPSGLIMLNRDASQVCEFCRRLEHRTKYRLLVQFRSILQEGYIVCCEDCHRLIMDGTISVARCREALMRPQYDRYRRAMRKPEASSQTRDNDGIATSSRDGSSQTKQKVDPVASKSSVRQPSTTTRVLEGIDDLLAEVHSSRQG